MLTLEQATRNVVFTKGLFSVDISAFQFDWDKLNTIFRSTFHKYERFCPKLKTLQTGGGNPIIMPEDCIYPRAIGFGNALMIPPQTVTVQSNGWSYDRDTRQLSVFTNTGSSASFKVQYLAKYSEVELSLEIEPYEVYEDEEEVCITLPSMPDLQTLLIMKGGDTLNITSRTRELIKFEGSFGSAALDTSTLELVIAQTDTSAGYIDISYNCKYTGYEMPFEDEDVFETWYAANILSSLGNVKAVLRMDMLPNSISADDLISQGRELMNTVYEWQREKSHWYMSYLGARV